MKRWFLAAAGLCFLVGAADGAYEELSVFAQAFHHVEQSYLRPVSGRTLVQGAIRGMVSVLDRRSGYALAGDRVVERPADRTQGFRVHATQEGLRVAEVYVAGPAERVLRFNDRILALDGASVADPTALRRALAGPPGTSLSLEVERSGQTLHVSMIRARFDGPWISHRVLGAGLQYLKIGRLREGTAAAVGRVLRRHSPSALVIDLRGNGGGLFDEAVRLADQFVQHGPLVRTRRRGHSEEVVQARRLGTESPYPVALLIDGRTASSAELFAAALVDNDRARAFGTQTFGKATVQSTIELSDASRLTLTVAEFFRPGGEALDGVGLRPDEPISGSHLRDPLRDVALESAERFLR